MKFACEPFSSELAAEILALSVDHGNALDPFPDKQRAIDTDFYRCNAPSTRIFTVRREGFLVGYAVVFVMKHPHYADSTQAQQDLMYLAPMYRRGLTGYRFLRFCDDELAKEGAEVIFRASSDKHDISALFTRLGYKPIEHVFARRIR